MHIPMNRPFRLFVRVFVYTFIIMNIHMDMGMYYCVCVVYLYLGTEIMEHGEIFEWAQALIANI